MLDAIFIASGIAFFLLTAVYADGCDRLVGAMQISFDYALGAIVTAGILIYLTYALIRAERF